MGSVPDSPRTIESPDDPGLAQLRSELAALGTELDVQGEWPQRQLSLCAEYGVFRWFLPAEWGGTDWSESDLVRGYLRLSSACLTTAFILTQRSGACRRILESDNYQAKTRLLPDLASGKSFATLGISHLTTSRRHLAKPAMTARPSDSDHRSGGFVLNGFSPWVTGVGHAETIVVGAALEDGQQLLAAVPTDATGVEALPAARLVGLSASQTGELRLKDVHVKPDQVLAGPAENVLSVGTAKGGVPKGPGTGGLQTSTLAIGLASAAIEYLETQAKERSQLADPAAGLRTEYLRLEETLSHLAAGEQVCSQDEFRAQANSLVLRSSQAALVAAKGTGYVIGHPAGRWCREALFFLVWSCPQGVANANLCELAGLAD